MKKLTIQEMGSRGGKSRWAKVDPKKRSEIMKKVSQARNAKNTTKTQK